MRDELQHQIECKHTATKQIVGRVIQTEYYTMWPLARFRSVSSTAVLAISRRAHAATIEKYT